MICKLCLQDKKLLTKSHIIPNFMYKGITDEKGRLFVLDTTRPEKKQVIQSGAYEANILCHECDNEILSGFETYANNHFYSKDYNAHNDKFQQIRNPDGACFTRCADIDYTKFKLFLMSILWRISISTYKQFTNFKLESEPEENLRKALLEGNPLATDDFACFVSTHALDEDVPTDLVIVKPYDGKVGIIYIDNFIYKYYINEILESGIDEVLLNPRNEMGIVRYPIGFWNEVRQGVLEYAVDIARRNRGDL